MGIKVAVIGGGSTYTPELVEGLATRRARLPIDELVLHDTDAQRLDVVGGLARRMLRRLDWTGRLTLSADARGAIDGAAFVLIQLRVGGQAARLLDETIPVKFGTIGQETTGAGGLAKALRTVPVVLELAGLVERYAAPGAWIVDFTNPVGIVTQALTDGGHRAIGLCNAARSVQRGLAARLGLEPRRLAVDSIGLNHLSWVTAVRVDGVDRLPELLDRHGAQLAGELRIPVDLIRRIGAIPSSYLRYYYAFDQVLAEQRAGHRRANEVMDIERRLLEMYADPALDTRPALLNERGGAFYSEAAAELIGSLHDNAGDVQVVDVQSGGAIPRLAHDDVAEVPARIGRRGAHPLRQRAMAPEILELVRTVKAYERLAITAALSGSPQDARAALETHPLVGPRIGDVEPLLDALLDANRAHLPRFAAAQ